MEHLRLNDGREVGVRPIRPSDGPLLLSLFWRMSPASRYRRFFCPMLTVSGNLVEYLTTIDHQDHEALVALDGEGAMVGEARYIRSHDDPREAELAITIVDDWQSDGLGTALVARLIERARAEGIEWLTGDVLWENKRMIALLHDFGVRRLQPNGPGEEQFALEVPAASAAAESPDPGQEAGAGAPARATP